MYGGYGPAMAKNQKAAVSFRLTEDEQALLTKVADERFGGNKTKALVEGLRALSDEKRMSKAALLAEIERRLK